MQDLFLVFMVPNGMFNSSDASFCVKPLKYNNSITALHLSLNLVTNSFNPIVFVELSKLELLSNILRKNQSLGFV